MAPGTHRRAHDGSVEIFSAARFKHTPARSPQNAGWQDLAPDSLSVGESALRRAWPTVLTAPLDLFGGRRIHRVIGYGVRALQKRREIFRSEDEQDPYNEERNERQVLAPGHDNSSLLLTRAAASSFCNYR